MRLDEPVTFEDMKQWLERWTHAHADQMSTRAVEADLDLGRGNVEKPMVALTFEGARRMGQFLLWATGEAELAVIEVSDERDVLIETREVTSLFGLRESLNAMVSAVLAEDVDWPLPL